MYYLANKYINKPATVRAGWASLFNVRISVLGEARLRWEGGVTYIKSSWGEILCECFVLKILDVGLCWTHSGVKEHKHDLFRTVT